MKDAKSHWENIYSDKSPLEVSWYQKEPTLSLKLISDMQLEQDAPIIDVGGGSSVLVDRLYEAGYTRLAVLDISSKALGYAKARFGSNADQIDWYEEDVTRFKPPHQFSLWHDRAVFHFLTEKSDRLDYLAVLQRTLVHGGHLIIAAFAIGGPSKCSGLDIVQYDAETLRAELGSDFELLDGFGELHLTPANKEQRFNYFHLVRK